MTEPTPEARELLNQAARDYAANAPHREKAAKDAANERSAR